MKLAAIGSLGCYAAAIPLMMVGARRTAMILVLAAVKLDMMAIESELAAMRKRVQDRELAELKRELEEDDYLV